MVQAGEQTQEISANETRRGEAITRPLSRPRSRLDPIRQVFWFLLGKEGKDKLHFHAIENVFFVVRERRSGIPEGDSRAGFARSLAQEAPSARF